MNRVLSFPQRHSCDDPAEAVSKRFCFSCIFSVSFISLIIGYLLGSRRPPNLNLIFVKSERDYLDMLKALQFDNKSTDFASLTSAPSSDYTEVTLLRDHFQTSQFDHVSEIFSTKILLTFRDEGRPDTIKIVGDREGVHYRYRKDTQYPYAIPPEAEEVRKLSSNISGLPIYVNFGTEDDFSYVIKNNISVQDHIVILRLGRISIFEKVSRALGRGAQGVLLFADPQQYPQVKNDSIQEDLSPLLIARLEKFQGCGSNCSLVLHVVSARTAEYILKDMETVNAAPESWHGSLSMNYSIGPGFNRRNLKLVIISNFISALITSHDVAGYLRGVDEPDRYVIVTSSRKSLQKLENCTDSINELMEVSKALAHLRHSRKWVPTRTIVFLSIGLDGLELYGNSWMQKHIDIIKYRTIAYLNVKSPIQGLYCRIEVCPILESLFSNLTLITENHSIFKHSHVHETEKVKSPPYRTSECKDEFLGRVSFEEGIKLSTYQWDESIENIILSYFGIPTVSFGCMKKNCDNVSSFFEDIVEARKEKYRTDIIRLWSFLTFSLTNRKILPFNFTAYSLKVENYNKTVSSFRESHNYSSIEKNYAKFSHSLQNLTFAMKTFQEEVQKPSKSLSTNRIVNEKLMLMQKLFICVFNTYDIIISHLNETSCTTASVLENELNTGEICATEIEYFIQDPYH